AGGGPGAGPRPRPVAAAGGGDGAAGAPSSGPRPTRTAGAVAAADGNARIAATSRTGTVAFPTGSGMTWPGWAFAVPKNARVAIAGSGTALSGCPAVSASCPATGTGAAPGFSMSSPVPTLKVSVAVPGRHALTAGPI